VFVLVPWLLQSALGTLYAADEQACVVGLCGGKISTAFQILLLSTVATAVAVAWMSYRYNSSPLQCGTKDAD
jgi:peptidoglycan/LPS O-acetylase OafA/YrhL